MTHTVTIDPINRIEGDLAVTIEIDDHNKITDAKCSGFVYRGFENIFKGKKPFDAMRMSTRACGVCPVSHGTVGAYAIEDAADFKIPRNAEIVRDIVLGTNFVVSHATHFYFMWAPDIVDDRYKKSKYYPVIKERFDPLKSPHLIKLLKEVRIPLHQIISMLGGRFPHPNHAVPGGVAIFPKEVDLLKMKSILKGVIDVVRSEVLNGIDPAAVLELKSVDEIKKLMKNDQFMGSDLGAFIAYGLDIGLHQYGEGTVDKFLSSGFGHLSDGSLLFKSGYVEHGKYHEFNPKHISEDTSHSYYETEKSWRHPSEGLTNPVARKEGAYSWIKSCRYFGHAVEVGPLARQVVNGNPLVLDLAKNFGVNNFTRTLGRVYEIVAVLVQVSKWLEELDVHKPFCYPFKDVKEGSGAGIYEAPRGVIGHWVNIKKGVVDSYQIITPTTWNCSPMDSKGQHSACETALIGTQLHDKDSIIEAGQIVRSFDPCISCSIHAVGSKAKSIKIEPTQ